MKLDFYRRSKDELVANAELLAAAAGRVGHQAAEAVDICRFLVEEVGVRVTGEEGVKALHAVAAQGNAEVCDYLLSLGLDVDQRDSAGRSALFAAAARGRNAALQTLLSRRADPSITDVEKQQTALFHAVRAECLSCVKMLLSARAASNHADRNGQSPLFFAAMSGKEDVVRLLLASNADTAATDSRGRSALFYAVHQSRLAVSRLLLNFPRGGSETLDDAIAEMARERGHHEIRDILRPRKTETALQALRSQTTEKIEEEAASDSNSTVFAVPSRSRFCIAFYKDRQKKQRVAFASAEYMSRLAKLASHHSWLQQFWPTDAPLTAGPR